MKFILFAAVVAAQFNFDWVWSLRYQTDDCLTGCVTRYDNAHYCDYDGVGYCCNTNSQNVRCTTDAGANVRCSAGVSTENMGYYFCLRDDAQCTSHDLTANATEYFVIVAEILYANADVCTYKLSPNATDEALYNYMNITTYYAEGVTLYAYTSTGDAYAAANETVLTAPGEFVYPVRETDENGESTPNYVYILAIPDENVKGATFKIGYSYVPEPEEDEGSDGPIEYNTTFYIVVIVVVSLITMVCCVLIARCLILRAKRREVPWEKNARFYIGDNYMQRNPQLESQGLQSCKLTNINLIHELLR